MSLTDVRIRQAKPAAKPFKLADGGGLYLLVQPSGSKLWRYKYRIDGTENVYAIGAYPQVVLADARREHLIARDRVRLGEHPVEHRRERKASSTNTFEAIGNDWHARTKEAKRWTARYAAQVLKGLEEDLYPKLGKKRITDIKIKDIHAILQAVEHRGAPTVAINLRQWASAIFVSAARAGLCESDPAAMLKGAIVRREIRHANALSLPSIGELLTRIHAYGGLGLTRHALLLIAYTFVRTIEARRAEWSEFDLKKGVWEIPAHKMKKKRIHLVPLSSQALAVIKSLHKMTGHGKYLFPNARKADSIMSNMAVNKAILHMGYETGEITGHDFRATASTLLYEAKYTEAVIEMQLAHVEANKTKRAYNHAQYMDERVAMMQWYADQLDASAAAHATPAS